MATEMMRVLSGPMGERMGWVLVHFLWEGAVVAAVLGVVLQMMRKRSVAGRYVAACCALALMVVLPVVTAEVVSVGSGQGPVVSGPASGQLPAASAQKGIGDGVYEGGSRGSRQGITEMRAEDARGENVPAKAGAMWRERVEAYLPWGVAGWMAGVVGMALWQVGGWMVVRRMRRRGRPVLEVAVVEMFERLRVRVGVRAAVRLLESALVKTPVVIGWMKPVILLPVGVMTGLSSRQMEAILVHELAHVRRWDVLVRMIQAAVETVLFFHPAVWGVSGRVRQLSEECCDEWALEVCGDREEYARALALVAGAVGPAGGLAAAAGGGKLLPRLRRILGVGEERSMGRTVASAAVALLVVAGVIVVPLACSVMKSPMDGEVVDAAALVEEVRAKEVWIDHVKSFRIKAESRWNYSPESLKAHMEELKTMVPGKDPGPALADSKDTLDLAFDQTRLYFYQNSGPFGENLKVWDGSAGIWNQWYYWSKEKKSYPQTDTKFLQSVEDEFAWPRASEHQMWWEKREGIPGYGEKSDAKGFKYVHRAVFEGMECYVLQRWDTERFQLARWYVGVKDHLLHKIEAGRYPGNPEGLRIFIEEAAKRGMVIKDEAEGEAWLGKLSKNEQMAVMEAVSSREVMTDKPVMELWMSDYVELKPGWWFPRRQGYISYGVSQGDHVEYGSWEHPLVDGRREFRVTEVNVNKPLPVELFKQAAQVGVAETSGLATQAATRGAVVGKLVAMLQASLPVGWTVESEAGEFRPRQWTKAGKGVEIRVMEIMATNNPPNGELDDAPIVHRLWVMDPGYDGEPGTPGPHGEVPQKDPAMEWGLWLGGRVICEEPPLGKMKDVLAKALAETESAADRSPETVSATQATTRAAGMKLVLEPEGRHLVKLTGVGTKAVGERIEWEWAAGVSPEVVVTARGRATVGGMANAVDELELKMDEANGAPNGAQKNRMVVENVEGRLRLTLETGEKKGELLEGNRIEVKMPEGKGASMNIVKPVGVLEPATLAEEETKRVVAGMVVDEKRKAVAGAEVAAVLYSGVRKGAVGRTHSGADGRFSLEIEGREPTVVYAFVPGVGMSASVMPGKEAVELRLLPAVDLGVTLVGPEGKGAGGVEVRPVMVLFGNGVSLGTALFVPPDLAGAFSGKTDDKGECVIHGLPRNARVRLDVDDERYAQLGYQQDMAMYLSGGAAVEAKPFQLKKAGTVWGKLVNPDTGLPVVGARIGAQAFDTNRDGGYGVDVTDAKGGFVLKRMRPGDYVVSVDDETIPGLAVRAADVDVVEGESVEAKLVVSRGGILKGQVTDAATGKGIAGVQMGLYGTARPQHAAAVYGRTTDAQGRYEFRVPGGEQYVYVMSDVDGYVETPGREHKTVEVKEGEATEADFALHADATPAVKGVVVGPDGKPVAGAMVYTNGEFGKTVQTDAEGRFEIRAREGMALRARWKDLATTAPVKVAGEGAVEMKLARNAIFNLTVQVKDDGGKPVKGAIVEVLMRTGMFYLSQDPRQVDAEGKVRFENLDLDTAYLVVAKGPDYLEKQSQVKSPKADESREVTVEMVMKRVGVLRTESAPATQAATRDGGK